MAVVVRTVEKLKIAMDNKSSVIYVEGELAEKIKKTEKLKTLSSAALKIVLGSIIVACGASAVTGGLSMVVAAGVATATATTTGVVLTPVAIVAIVAIGAGLVLTMYKDYDIKVELDSKGKARIILTRKFH